MTGDPYTYAALKAEVKSSIWPNGAPENLVTAIDRTILQAVNWIQQNVECLKDEHLDFTPQCSTYFHCGLTVIDKPDGIVHRLFTIQHAGFCDPVTYDETDKETVLRWSRWFMKLVTNPVNEGLKKLPGGFSFGEAGTNAADGRAIVGLWAKDRSRIWIAPWLQSYEAVGVEWTGYKSKWNDADLVPDAPDYKRAVKLFVQKEFARDFERDPGFAQFANDDFHGNPARGVWGAIPALIHQCREKTRQRKSDHNAVESDYLWLNYAKPESVVPVEDSTVLAVIGDYGLDGTPEADVAALVKSWSPSHILTLGDNNYPSGASGTIDANIGKHYFEYITPYHGIYGAERGVNRFWPVLGNHDLDTGDGVAYFDYFSLPNNERYYEKVFGHVHVFFINSGYNTAGTLTESDGNSETSVQANWILMRAARSTVKWKIAVFHHPPYTSRPAGGFGYYPGNAALRWNWAKYGFNAVLSGHGHAYERIIVDDFPYFVNGAGGGALVPFTGPLVTGSAKQYAADYGAMKVTATCSKLTLAFENVDGEEIDSYEIT